MTTDKFFIIMCTAMIAAGTLQSCMKERECPPLNTSQLFVAVGEKNYQNIGEITQLIPSDEGLAFRNYVGLLDIIYRLDDRLSDPGIRRSFLPEEDEIVAELPGESLSRGLYEIIVTGNAVAGNFTGTDDYLLELHPEGMESGDVYMVRDDVVFPLDEDRTLSLKRTKGLLLLYYRTLPAQVAGLNLTATGVSKNVDEMMNFSGTTSVAKDFTLPSSSGPGAFKMFLAPTVEAAEPKLSIDLYDNAGNAVRSLSGIDLPVLRNRITAFELRYGSEEDSWEIWIYADGVWEQVHRLTIN